MLNYESYGVLTFDCYGTLIDWESGILAGLRPVFHNHGVTIDDEHLLQAYAAHEAKIEAGPYQPYRSVLQQAMVDLGEEFAFKPTANEKTALVDSFGDWPPFVDTVAALRKLRQKFKLAIISNVDDDLFALTNRRLEIDFDFVITAGQVGAYKPSPLVFEQALATIGQPKETILHVAQSLYHDHVPAKQLGFSTAWINRRQGRAGSGATPPAEAKPDAEFSDLASLVKAAGL